MWTTWNPEDVEVSNVCKQKVEERFHRNTSIPVNDDVAKRVFLLAENQIELTYHLEDFRTISSTRTFRKPRLATETQKAEEFTAANVHTFQVQTADTESTAAYQVKHINVCV